MDGGAALSGLIKVWREDPVLFVRDQFGVEPDAWQADALRAFAKPGRKRIALSACAGPGKSACLAWMAWNFLACYAGDGEHPKGAAVAITRENLRDNFWAELANWRNRSDFLKLMFGWQAERIFAKAHPETWFISARAWPKTASAEEQGRTLSGLHSKFVFAAIDESAEVPLSVLKTAEQALSNCEFGAIVQAGNPTTKAGMLGAACTTLRDQWIVIPISGDPDDPKRSPRVDKEWAARQIAQYGRDDPWVMAYILGQFPPADFNALLSIEDVQAAMARSVRKEEIAGHPRILGVDVAREGLDRSCIFRRQGLVANWMPKRYGNVDGTQGAAYLAQEWREWDADAAFVDNTGGFGASWIDQARLLRLQPIPIHFSSKALDNRYGNRRAEMWWKMCEWVKSGGCLPKELTEIVPQLTEARYYFKRDQVFLEEKEQMKVRIRRSPDEADALALTFAAPVAPRVRTFSDAERFLERMRDGGGEGERYDFFERMETRF